MKPLVAVLVTAALAACAPSSPRDARGSDPPAAAPAAAASAPAAAKADTGQVARLERQARALAHTEGCGAGACRTAPLGSRPCGGPREYLVYCAATTDSVALFAKLDELAHAEEEINRNSGTMSTCEYRTPPNATVQGGRCVATPSTEPPVQ
jgi:hypothetical protein